MNDPLYPQPYHLGSAQPFEPFYPLAGMPGGPMAGVAASLGMQAMGNPFGLQLGFHQPGNLYNNLGNQAFITQNAMAAQHATPTQSAAILDGMRALAAMNNRKWDAAQERDAAKVAQQLTENFGPLLAQSNPYMLDLLSGGRSGMVLAQGLHQGNRYRYDPVSGYMGMPAENAGRLSRDLFSDFYGDRFENGQLVESGSTAWRRRVHGVNTYEMSQLYQSLAARGQIERASSEGLDLTTAEGKETMYGRELEAVKRSLAGRTKMVKAMQEIFGENGRPNAPMEELLNALETLTTGVQKWSDPERVTMSVRQFANAAKGANINLQTAGALLEGNIGYLRTLGPNMEAFGMPIATMQMTMMGALNDRGVGALNGWGLMNTTQMAGYGAQRTARAADSTYANFLGAVARMGETYGFEDNAQGARLRQIAAEIKSGSISDETLSLLSGSAQARYELIAGGVTGIGDVNSAFREIEMMQQNNQAAIHRNDIQNTVALDGQRFQLRNDILGGKRGIAFSTMQGNVRAMGGNAAIGAIMAGVVADTYLDGLTDQEQADWETSKTAGTKLAGAMKARLQEIAAGGGPDAAAAQAMLAQDDIDTRLRVAALQQLGVGNSQAVKDGRISGSIANVALATSPAAREQMERRRQWNKAEAIAQDMLTGRQENDPMRRAVQAFYRAGANRKAGETADWSKILIDAMGGDSQGIAASGLVEIMASIEAEDEAIVSEANAIAKILEKDPTNKDALRRKKQLEIKTDTLNAQYNNAVGKIQSNEKLRDYIQQNFLGEEAAEGEGSGQTITVTINELNINGESYGRQTAKGTGGAKPAHRGQPGM